MPRRQVVLLSLSFSFLSCNSPENNTKVETSAKPFEWKARYKNTDSVRNTPSKAKESKEMEELLKKWTWNEKMSRPSKSSISNAKYPSDLLLVTWTWSDDN